MISNVRAAWCISRKRIINITNCRLASKFETYWVFIRALFFLYFGRFASKNLNAPANGTCRMLFCFSFLANIALALASVSILYSFMLIFCSFLSFASRFATRQQPLRTFVKLGSRRMSTFNPQYSLIHQFIKPRNLFSAPGVTRIPFVCLKCFTNSHNRLFQSTITDVRKKPFTYC